MYFSDVKVDDEVFGLIYGRGFVRTVLDGFFKFEVEYENGQVVPYTEDGIPGWNTKLDFQTVAYAKDINFSDFDFSEKFTEEELGAKKIMKYRMKGKLEVKCPSGIWVDSKRCPFDIIESYIEDRKFYLFREKSES
jgi:hypothetical protein